MSKELEDFNAKLAADAELDRRKKAVSEKELDLKEKRVDQQFSDLVKNKEETEKSQSVSFGRMTEEALEQLRIDNKSYLEAAKHPIPFICSEFDNHVPFFRKNLLLLMASTGSGKSTAVCNITYSAIKHRNPLTSKGYRVLILTNEEAPEDMLNRLTCFAKGWRYSNHNTFNDSQRDEFDKFIQIFAKKGNVTVIGDKYASINGWTTTVEGVVQVFDNMIRDKDFYDIVILDYAQGVVRSRDNPSLNEYEAQRLLANEFDRIKNIYPGVIVVMAQADPLKDEDDTTPYNVRLKGSKLIVTKATFICEIIPEHKLLRSKWKIHKSRFTDSIGMEIFTGFDKGRFIPYSKEFQLNVAKIVERNLEQQKEQELGMPSEKNEELDPEKTVEMKD